MRTKCQVLVPLAPPWKLLNIPLSVPHQEEATRYLGSCQQRGEKQREAGRKWTRRGRGWQETKGGTCAWRKYKGRDRGERRG